jgi:triacylglycerol lipase
MLLRSCRTYITCVVALCAISSSTVLVLFAGIAAACGGTGGGGECPAPSVSTGGATSVTSTNATLNGSVTPQGCYTEYSFEWGRSSEGYPNEVISAAGSGTSPVSVHTSSVSLQPSTSYHFRLSAWSEGGEVTGGSSSFTTPGGTEACAKPTVATEAASPVGISSATLNGKVNPNGCDTTYTFEYGYAASGTYSKSNGSVGKVSGPVWQKISNLEPGKLYTFRLTANNIKGTSEGSFLYFSTIPVDPIVFVHGWNGAAGGWNQWISWFQQQGWPSSYLNDWSYSSAQTNEAIAQQLSSKVNLVLSQTGKTKVDLITHSMGGLSGRYYLKNLGGTAKVDEFVSLGGPNHGTSDAALAFCGSTPMSCNQMKENSPFLTSLNAGDETPGAVRYLTIGSDCDPVINPDSSVMLSGAVENLVWDTPLLSCPNSHSLLRTDSWPYGKVLPFVK